MRLDEVDIECYFLCSRCNKIIQSRFEKSHYRSLFGPNSCDRIWTEIDDGYSDPIVVYTQTFGANVKDG